MTLITHIIWSLQAVYFCRIGVDQLLPMLMLGIIDGWGDSMICVADLAICLVYEFFFFLLIDTFMIAGSNNINYCFPLMAIV